MALRRLLYLNDVPVGTCRLVLCPESPGDLPGLLLAELGGRSKAVLVGYTDLDPESYAEAQAHAEEHGNDYLGPLTAPSLPYDPRHVGCRRCGRVSAHRLGDISFGCECVPR